MPKFDAPVAAEPELASYDEWYEATERLNALVKEGKPAAAFEFLASEYPWNVASPADLGEAHVKYFLGARKYAGEFWAGRCGAGAKRAIDHLDLDEAFRWTQLARSHADVMGPSIRSIAFHSDCRAYLRVGRVDDAARSASAAYALAREDLVGDFAAFNLDAYIDAALDRSDVYRAQNELDQAIAVASRLDSEIDDLIARVLQRNGRSGRGGAKDFVAIRRTIWANLAIKLIDPQAPAEDFARGAALAQRVIGDERAYWEDRRAAAARLAYARLDRGETQLARELLEFIDATPVDEPVAGPKFRAWVAGLRSWLSVSAGGDLEAAREELAADLEQAFTAIRGLPPMEGGTSSLHYAGFRFAICQLIGLEMRAHGADAAFECYLKTQGCGRLERSLGVTNTRLAVVRSHLVTQDSGLLCYFFGKRESWVFLVESERVTAEPLDASSLVEGLSKDWAEAFHVPLDTDDPSALDAIERAGRALAERLVPATIQRRLRGLRGVTVVGIDMLQKSAPIEALPLAGSALGLTHALHRLPSVNVGVALARRSTAGPADRRGLVSLQSPTLAPEVRAAYPGLSDLPVDARVYSAWRRAGETLLLRGSSATLDRLAGPELTQARVLHIVAHGVHTAGPGAPPAILLARCGSSRRGYLTRAEIEALDSPEFVALTVCRAGAGPLRVGDEGSSHLGGAFLGAGANAVLLAREVVFVEPSHAFTKVTLGLLCDGVPLAEAARLARHEVRSTKAWSDPRIWATIGVYGNGGLVLAPD